MAKKGSKFKKYSPEFKISCIIDMMINKLIEKLSNNVTPILHSDQGWQYQMKEYQRILKENIKREQYTTKHVEKGQLFR